MWGVLALFLGSELFGAKNPVNLARRDSSSKSRQTCPGSGAGMAQSKVWVITYSLPLSC